MSELSGQVAKGVIGKAKLFLERAFPRLQPSAICIGAQKGGTSALYKYLACHRGVAPSKIKEIDFFNCTSRFARGLDFYHSHFPRKTPLNSQKLTFDITPGYLFGGGKAAERIRGYNPAIKLIVLMRNPITRAHSAWQMYKRYYRGNPEWFFNWIRRCDQSWPTELFLRRPATFGNNFEQDIRDEIAAMERGRTIEMPILLLGEYEKLLKPYYERFPRNQILALSSEQMQQDTAGHLRRIESFVGLPPHPWSRKQLAPRFVGGYRDSIEPKAREVLKEFYAPQNGALFKLLQSEFVWD